MEIFKEIKLLWKYLKKYKRKIRYLAFLAVVASVMTALIPFIYGRIVDLLSIGVKDFMFIIALLGIWILISVFSAFATRKVNLKGGSVGIDVSNDFTCNAASHVVDLPLSFHNEKKAGEIFSKIQRADRYFFQIIDNIVFWFLPHFLSILFAVIILFFVEWRLALGMTIVFLGYFLITVHKTKPIVERHTELNKVYERVFGNLYDSLSNIQIIKSCAAEDFQAKRTEKNFREDFKTVFKKFIGLWNSLHLWQDVFYDLAFVAILGSAILLLSRGTLSPGKLIMFLGYLGLARMPLKAFAFHWQSFRTGITTIKRVEELLQIDKEDFNEEGKVVEDPTGKVEFKNISFGYKKESKVLKDISFVVKSGQKIALVGGSGEGKTTLVDLISLYFKPREGMIFFDDIDIQDLNLHFLRRIIAYVPQEISLFNDTVKNNICYGNPEATDGEIIVAARAANAHKFIESFPQKYDTLVGERGIKLSTGQKQRVAIARAIIRDPKILILDEATSSLDSESEKLVQEALDRLIKGRTTFIVAHRLSTIKEADNILVLEGGRIIEKGTHNELIKKKGTYFKFYSLQFKKK
jgi:ABC-type multidrug transport system fused ATPase/permease subunit